MKNYEKEDKFVSRMLDRFVFCWNDVPGRDNEKLINHLVKDRKIEWVKNAEIKKTHDTIIITKGENWLEMELWKDKVILRVKGGKTYTYDVKKEGDYLNIYKIDIGFLVFSSLKFTSIIFVAVLSISFMGCYLTHYLQSQRECYILSWLSSFPSTIITDVLIIFIIMFLFIFFFVLRENLKKRCDF